MTRTRKRNARELERPARITPASGSRPVAWMTALVLGALLATLAGHAHAGLYKWIDERGIVHYSDQLPVEAVNRASLELNRNGVAVRKTEQARPVVQRPQPKNETEEQVARQAERDRMLAVRRDRALIESYANEAEIDLAKSRAVATIDGQTQSAAAFIAQMTKRRAELESQKVTYAPRPVPGAIEREIETIDAELARQNELIAGKKKEAATVAARYDADKLRFRELRSTEPSGAVITSSDGRYSSAGSAPLKLTSAH